MKFSIPLIICDENEEVRRLLKEMLIKHGFFHLVETHTSVEVSQLFSTSHFIIIHKKLLNGTIQKQLLSSRKYIIIAQNDDDETVKLSAIYGVEHLISFPYTSKALAEKIHVLTN